MPMRLEPTPLSGVKHSTSEALRSLKNNSFTVIYLCHQIYMRGSRKFFSEGGPTMTTYFLVDVWVQI